MTFFIENWHTKCQGPKYRYFFRRMRVHSYPSHTSTNQGSFTPVPKLHLFFSKYVETKLYSKIYANFLSVDFLNKTNLYLIKIEMTFRFAKALVIIFGTGLLSHSILFTVFGKILGTLYPFFILRTTLNGKSSGKPPLSRGMRGRGLTPGRLRDGQNAPKNASGLRQQLLLKFKNEK